MLYNAQAKNSGKLPLPLGDKNRYAPVALGDVAQMAAIVLTGEGHKGLDDRHRGQLMLATGPMLLSGKDIAEVAGQVLDVKLEYEDIQEYVISLPFIQPFSILVQIRGEKVTGRSSRFGLGREGLLDRVLSTRSGGGHQLYLDDCIPRFGKQGTDRTHRIFYVVRRRI